jgi:hypothetical protein
MVINELMSSRKWKGAKVCDGIAPQEKFFNQQNLVAGGAKTEPEKFVHQRKNWGGRKEKERRAPGCGKNLPPTKFGKKTQNFKIVKMIINYGG